MTGRIVAVVVSLQLASGVLPASAGISRTLPSSDQARQIMATGETPVFEVAQDPEEFRAQLLDFLRETDEAMQLALAHPAIGPALAGELGTRGMSFPLPVDVYGVIETADAEALLQVRTGFDAAPGALAAPALLREAVGRLPPPDDPVFGVASDGRATCQDVYTEFNRLAPLAEAQRGVAIGRNVVILLRDVFTLIWQIVNSQVAVCEFPVDIWLSWAQGPLILVRGIADVIDLALGLTSDVLGFQAVDADRCINLKTCPPQGFTERFRPDEAPSLAGRGCDERDNNCSGGIDEIDEDRFPPTVSIDAALTSRCYDDASTAEAAARLAVRASDDCVSLSQSPQAHQGALDVSFNRAGCFGTLMATATDKKGNVGTANAAVIIDDVAPQIALQDPGLCQPDVESARLAFGFVASDTCTAVQSDVRVVEKECVADFEFDAVDGCGNRSTELRSVRLDHAAPDVNIERLLLPDVRGRLCFASEAGAVGEVEEATTISDNCTDRSDLSFMTTAAPTGGNTCDRLVTSMATDTCGLSTTDAVVTRIDTEPPVVTCSVTQPILWPADSTMRDVGFAMTVSDNCGAQDVTVDVKVTSDEPTSLDLSVQGANDPVPDATIVGNGLGGISAILIRAERQQTQSADGRVYRIRVTGTDGCGNSSFADCYVSVPKSLSNNRSELVNSGQMFDATVAN